MDPVEFLEVSAVDQAVGEALERDDVREAADQHRSTVPFSRVART